MAGACEMLQAVVHRSADFYDFLRGMIGSILVVLVVKQFEVAAQVGPVLIHAALAMVLLIWPLADAFPKLWTRGTRTAPSGHLRFSDALGTHRWSKDHATVQRVTEAELAGTLGGPD